MKGITPMTLDEFQTVTKNADEGTSMDTKYLSPLTSSNQAVISENARQKILDYAYPIDSALTKKLDNPLINTALSKFVQFQVDRQSSITLATGIHITKKTAPDLFEIVKECADMLDVPIPYVVITDSIRGLNAQTCGTNQFSYIAISSLLPMVMDRSAISFVIGHELGHIAMGHTLYHQAGSIIAAAGTMLPLVGPVLSGTIVYPLNAWYRRSEITADRAGLICCKDIESAKRTLLQLEAGLLNIKNIDVDDYVRESQTIMQHSSFGKLAEYAYDHPVIPKRIKALELFYNSEPYVDAVGIPKAPGMLKKDELNQQTGEIIKILDLPTHT